MMLVTESLTNKLRSSNKNWFDQTSSQVESSWRDLIKVAYGTPSRGGKGCVSVDSVNQGTTSLGLYTALDWNPQGSRESVRPKQSWPEALCNGGIRKLSRYEDLIMISCSHFRILVMSSFSLSLSFLCIQREKKKN